MQNSIPYLVQLMLLSGRRVSMPGVGTLCLERMASEVLDGGYISAPYDCLQLCDIADGEDFVAVLAQWLRENSNIGGYFDEESFLVRARELYDEWLAGCLDESGLVLTIEGVCVVDCGVEVLSISDSLSMILEPYDSAVYIGEPSFVGSEESLPEEQSQENINEGQNVDSEEVAQLRTKVAELEQRLVESENSASLLAARRATRTLPVQKISTFWWISSIVMFCASILYLAFLYFKGTLL